MKRKRLLIILFSLFTTVTLGALLWQCEREPEYDGVPLSEWVLRYERAIQSGSINEVTNANKAFAAIDHIGTNSLPFLVRWIQYETPAWRSALRASLQKLPDRVPLNLTFIQLLRDLDDKPCDRADGAADAFQILGPKAQPAIPELRRLAQGYPMKDTDSRAISLLYLLHDDEFASQILQKARTR